MILIENFHLVQKQNKENFVKKIVDSGIVKTCDELDLGSTKSLSSTSDLDLSSNRVSIVSKYLEVVIKTVLWQLNWIPAIEKYRVRH